MTTCIQLFVLSLYRFVGLNCFLQELNRVLCEKLEEKMKVCWGWLSAGAVQLRPGGHATLCWRLGQYRSLPLVACMLGCYCGAVSTWGAVRHFGARFGIRAWEALCLLQHSTQVHARAHTGRRAPLWRR